MKKITKTEKERYLKPWWVNIFHIWILQHFGNLRIPTNSKPKKSVIHIQGHTIIKLKKYSYTDENPRSRQRIQKEARESEATAVGPWKKLWRLICLCLQLQMDVVHVRLLQLQSSYGRWPKCLGPSNHGGHLVKCLPFSTYVSLSLPHFLLVTLLFKQINNSLITKKGNYEYQRRMEAYL